jgi:hypothetical protein
MAEMSLIDIFPGATQDSAQITIPKADLLTLIAEENNRGDSIVVALLKSLLFAYPPNKRAVDPDVSIIVQEGRTLTETKYEGSVPVEFWQNRSIEVNLYSRYEQPPLSASDY